MAGINLRDEALKFIRHVRLTQYGSYFVPEAQNLAAPAPGPQMTAAQRLIFTESVRGRFPEDDPHNHKIFPELLNTIYAVQHGIMPKPEAYAKACSLLIGHADLFHQFERFLNHREVGAWRAQVRGKFMLELEVLTEGCRSTVQAIMEAPENLNADHRDCIMRLFISEIDDTVARNELFAALQLDPDQYRRYVKPGLETKLNVLGELLGFFTDFFDQLNVRDLSLAGF